MMYRSLLRAGSRLSRWSPPCLALLLAACVSVQPATAPAPASVTSPLAATFPYPTLTLDPSGWISEARIEPSPNHGPRDSLQPVSMLVIHNISLPPGQYGGESVIRLFMSRLTPAEVPYDPDLLRLRVSAHFLIRRDGQIVQFVSTDRRAMHAGNSYWNGQGNINNRSLGIELEGSNLEPYEDAQYASLAVLTRTLQAAYPLTEILGHADVAPGRKTDPGPYFDWHRYSLQTGTMQRLFSGPGRAHAGPQGTRPTLPHEGARAIGLSSRDYPS